MKVLIFYSGGKDSQASLILAINKYGLNNCEAVFCDTGWENPLTYNHIINTCKQLNVKLVTLKSKKYNGFIDLAIKKKRFPSIKARFCTEELKIIPSIDYVLSHNENLIIIEGIRKNESFIRSKMDDQCTYFKYYFQPYGHDKHGKPKLHTYRKKDVITWTQNFNADKIRPIFNWTAQQTIDFIKENGQLPNPLYFLGFKRVGCFPCIMNNHQGIKLIIENHPEQWQQLKDNEKLVKSTFFRPDYIPRYARTGITAKGKKITLAIDVENYIKKRNSTIDLFEHDTPGCMSAYNLCE